uniref:Uncharacterized protein n=1 Tax=Wuchereria bancrofti TaxID=6293 RepID=A0AAF5PQS1_WUCBA
MKTARFPSTTLFCITGILTLFVINIIDDINGDDGNMHNIIGDDNINGDDHEMNISGSNINGRDNMSNIIDDINGDDGNTVIGDGNNSDDSSTSITGCNNIYEQHPPKSKIC